MPFFLLCILVILELQPAKSCQANQAGTDALQALDAVGEPTFFFFAMKDIPGFCCCCCFVGMLQSLMFLSSALGSFLKYFWRLSLGELLENVFGNIFKVFLYIYIYIYKCGMIIFPSSQHTFSVMGDQQPVVKHVEPRRGPSTSSS